MSKKTRGTGKLKLYRRHLNNCQHKHKGRGYDSCRCPIWVQGTWAWREDAPLARR